MKPRICLYFKTRPEKDRFLPGDRKVIPLLRKWIRGKRVSSLEQVFINLCKGFDRLNVDYLVNLPFNQLLPNDRVIVLGIGREVLEGYNKSNKIVAGIGLMTHPAEWPLLFKDYPVAVYLQHSQWPAAIYNRWYGEGSCKIWPAGIDTEWWKPSEKLEKKQLLVYVKFLWDRHQNKETLLEPILRQLAEQNINYSIIEYGSYKVEEYREELEKSYGMIFLCEHESQGLACQEAMAMNVPVLAWDQGLWLDPNRVKWGESSDVPASSVPYFDSSCGEKFKDLDEFYQKLPLFLSKIKQYQPRKYVEGNLSLTESAKKILKIIDETYKAIT